MGFQRENTGCVFCLVFCFEICKVENLQERKEREGRAEDQKSPNLPKGRRKGRRRRREEGARLDSAGLCFLQYLFFKIFFLVRNIFF